MEITRFPQLTESQFLGCVSAFADSLTGELNSAAMYLRKLAGRAKGGAFAYEMSLDHHRYGALLVLDRWSTLVNAFGPHLQLSRYPTIIGETGARVRTAEEILGRTNNVIDAAASYSEEVVEGCILAYQSLNVTFAEERNAAGQSAQLGPMLPDDFRQARRIFLEDLAAR